jgi:hypothetical protein
MITVVTGEVAEIIITGATVIMTVVTGVMETNLTMTTMVTMADGVTDSLTMATMITVAVMTIAATGVADHQTAAVMTGAMVVSVFLKMEITAGACAGFNILTPYILTERSPVMGDLFCLYIVVHF